MAGAELARPFIEAAEPRHPSLIDTTHQMDSLFGVVNVPNVVWIDEAGTIVRPAEPGWPPATDRPEAPRPARRPLSAGTREDRKALRERIASGQDRARYPDAIREWAANGEASAFALTPEEVVARSQPRPPEVSAAAAHFELGNHLWRQGEHDAAIAHFNASHRLQPDNWTYKRQAWSAVSAERVEGPGGIFVQGPAEGDEAPWPFDSDFFTDALKLGPGEYYPKTL